MGWSFRKSLQLLPGIRINLSKSGPRLSVGVPGARASIDVHGKTRIYGGTGPIRFQKTVGLSSNRISPGGQTSLLSLIKRMFGEG
jgi:hypothetical protein